jgi:hypothetical protein
MLRKENESLRLETATLRKNLCNHGISDVEDVKAGSSLVSCADGRL